MIGRQMLTSIPMIDPIQFLGCITITSKQLLIKSANAYVAHFRCTVEFRCLVYKYFYNFIHMSFRSEKKH